MIFDTVERETPAVQTRARAALTKLLDLTDPVESQREELRAAGIEPSRISTLYPLDLAENIEGFTNLLDTDAVRQQTSELLTECQFETAVTALPASISYPARVELAAAGMDDHAKWSGAFNTALHEIDNGWLAYQYIHLLVFLQAVATAPSLREELVYFLGGTSIPEHYEGPWTALTKWVTEAEDAAQRLVRVAGNP